MTRVFVGSGSPASGWPAIDHQVVRDIEVVAGKGGRSFDHGPSVGLGRGVVALPRTQEEIDGDRSSEQQEADDRVPSPPRTVRGGYERVFAPLGNLAFREPTIQEGVPAANNRWSLAPSALFSGA